MKMLFCLNCYDMFLLNYDARSCTCKKTSGFFVKDGKDRNKTEKIVFKGPCVPLVIRWDDFLNGISGHNFNNEKYKIPMYIQDLSDDPNIVHYDDDKIEDLPKDHIVHYCWWVYMLNKTYDGDENVSIKLEDDIFEKLNDLFKSKTGYTFKEYEDKYYKKDK